MKNIACSLSLLSLLIVCSCKKNDADSNDNPQTAKVKTYKEDYTVGGNNYVSNFRLNYDAEGRLQNMVSTASAGDRFQFQYDNGAITMEMYLDNELSIHEAFFLSPDEKVDSTVQYNDANEFSAERYFYNTNGQVTKLISYDYFGPTPEISNVANFTYDNRGNITQSKDRFSVSTYEYYEDYPATPTLGFPTLQQSANLVKTNTTTFGYLPQTLNHMYTFDSKKRLTTEKIKSTTGEVMIKTYTY